MTARPVPDQALRSRRPHRRLHGGIFDRGDAAVGRRHRGACVLGRGTRVYLSAVPNRPADELLAAAMPVRAAGLEPVPHVAVRNFASEQALDDFLARLNGEAKVDHVLVIAGDRNEYGPFRRALDVIDNGVLRRRGIRGIGIAGYPQGHPRIGDDATGRSQKRSRRRKRPGLPSKSSASSASMPAILDFIARLRGFGFEHRVRVGLVGPTSLTSLMRYASRCGVRASAQGLARRSGLMRQMFALTTPDDLIRTLAQAAPAGVVPHFFSFGGVPATSRWASAVADGRIALDAGGGFRVEAPPGDAQR